MTQQITPPDGDVPPTTPDGGEARTEISSLPTDIQDMIRDLRKEARKANDAKKEADRLRAQEQENKLKEANDWKALADQRERELAEAKPKAQLVDEMQNYLASKATAAVAALPKQWQSAVPKKYTDPRDILEWIDDNAALMRAQVPVNIGAGAQGNGSNGAPVKQKVPMSAEFAAQAEKMRMPPEQAQRAWDAEHNKA